MLAHTKKPLIRAKRPSSRSSNNSELDFGKIKILVSVPMVNADQIKQYLEKQGCVCIDDNPSTEIKEQEWVNAKGLFAERTPANMLIGARGKENITQAQLSKITGIPRRHISDMENGRRPIGKQNALKLEKALNVSYRLFL